MPFLWKDLDIKPEHYLPVLNTLVASGVIFPLNSMDGETSALTVVGERLFIMPVRLKDDPSTSVLEVRCVKRSQ